MSWERARKPEQKEVRRNAILDAARVLFSDLKYDEISLNAIAREAGISKPNVYRYFASREEIFLAIFEEEHGRFVSKLIERLKRLRGKDIVAGIARAWVDTGLEHPEFMELLPQLSISMEENSSVEQLVAFKQTTDANSAELIQELCNVYPQLNGETWGSIVSLAACLMTGLWPFTNPSDHVREAKQKAGHKLEWDFATMMKAGFVSLVRGANV